MEGEEGEQGHETLHSECALSLLSRPFVSFCKASCTEYTRCIELGAGERGEREEKEGYAG